MDNYDQEIEGARQTLTGAVAVEISAAYTDNAVFPLRVVIDRVGSAERQFPGWPDDVLVIAVENQGVCSWGLSLGGESSGVVVVGGELSDGPGTVPYASSLASYVRSRKWDSECLEREPLLQAQGAVLDEATVAFLRSRFTELDPTFGWPCSANFRFETDGVVLMLRSCDQQCDWWISGDEPRLANLLSELMTVSDLSTALWSNDAAGIEILAAHRADS